MFYKLMSFWYWISHKELIKQINQTKSVYSSSLVIKLSKSVWLLDPFYKLFQVTQLSMTIEPVLLNLPSYPTLYDYRAYFTNFSKLTHFLWT